MLGYQLYRAVQTGQTLGKRMLGIRMVATPPPTRVSTNVGT